MNTGTNVANALKEPWKIAAAMTEPDLTRMNCAIGARQIQKTIIINTPVTGWAGKLCPIRMTGAYQKPPRPRRGRKMAPNREERTMP